MEPSFAEVNGYRLRYRIAGEGPLAVLGHGLLGSIEQIAEHQPGLDELETRVRLLTYDARGHGQSDGPTTAAEYSWESLGRDMSAFIEAYGEATPAIAGGGSMGAATALWVALERPGLVRALVLVMPPPLGRRPMRGEGERQAILTLDLLAAAVQNYGLERTVELARQIPGFAESPEAADERARWLLAQNPLALSYAIRGLLDSPSHDPECYRAIRVPTLVVCHERDGLHPVRSGALLRDHIPDCTLEVAPEPGYWREHPDEFRGIVTAFLDRLS